MEIIELKEFIEESRKKFRNKLRERSDESVEGLKELIVEMFAKCCSTFEEETLKENLQEEFKLYMEGMTKGA